MPRHTQPGRCALFALILLPLLCLPGCRDRSTAPTPPVAPPTATDPPRTPTAPPPASLTVDRMRAAAAGLALRADWPTTLRTLTTTLGPPTHIDGDAHSWALTVPNGDCFFMSIHRDAAGPNGPMVGLMAHPSRVRPKGPPGPIERCRALTGPPVDPAQPRGRPPP